MDNIVETVVWVALIGGTAAVILVQLPRICIWCLEIVERAQKIRFHKKLLAKRTPRKNGAGASEGVRIVTRSRET